MPPGRTLVAVFITPEVKIEAANRQALAEAYSLRIVNSRTDRDKAMRDIWALALTNYEGKAPIMNWPWKDASNAVIPLTASHTDAWISRLRNAGASHDPMYLTSPLNSGDLIGGMTASDYSELWQKYSEFVEKNVVNNKALMDRVSTVTAKYGVSFVYLPWEYDIVLDPEVSPSGEVTFVERDRVNAPVPHV